MSSLSVDDLPDTPFKNEGQRTVFNMAEEYYRLLSRIKAYTWYFYINKFVPDLLANLEFEYSYIYPSIKKLKQVDPELDAIRDKFKQVRVLIATRQANSRAGLNSQDLNLNSARDILLDISGVLTDLEDRKGMLQPKNQEKARWKYGD